MPTALPPAKPLLPPYGHLNQQSVECVAAASRYYDVPELLLHAILQKENGRVGTMSPNKNGTYDLGLPQINSAWVPLFAPWGIGLKELRDNACTSIYAEAWVLRYNANQVSNDWFKATMAYNVGVQTRVGGRLLTGYHYAVDVTQRWWKLHRALTGESPVARNSLAEPTAFKP